MFVQKAMFSHGNLTPYICYCFYEFESFFVGTGYYGLESSNTYGRTTINTLDYLQALSVSTEGEIEMEVRTWRGTRWISVFLHIDVDSFAVSELE